MQRVFVIVLTAGLFMITFTPNGWAEDPPAPTDAFTCDMWEPLYGFVWEGNDPRDCVPEFEAPCWSLGGVAVKCAWAHASLQYGTRTQCDGQPQDPTLKCAIAEWASNGFTALGGACLHTGQFDGITMDARQDVVGAAGNCIFLPEEEKNLVPTGTVHCATTEHQVVDVAIVLATVATDEDCGIA